MKNPRITILVLLGMVTAFAVHPGGGDSGFYSFSCDISFGARRARGEKCFQESRPIVSLPYGMLYNSAFLDVYWEMLLNGIRVDAGTPDILFELKRLQVGGQDLLIINFVARPINVTEVDLDEVGVSVSPGEVAELWQDFLASRNCLYKSIAITGLKPDEDFKPYSILHIDKEELEAMAIYLLRGWSGAAGEGLGTEMLSACKLIAETVNIGLKLNFVSKQELLSHSLDKNDFAGFFEELGRRMLGCREEKVIMDSGGERRFPAEQIRELGDTVMNKFLPWMNSKSGMVIYRVVYTGYIRMLRD